MSTQTENANNVAQGAGQQPAVAHSGPQTGHHSQEDQPKETSLPHRPTPAAQLKDKITDKKEKLRDKNNPPGGYDATPLPHAPPGYTVKFTFHEADNLPSADLHTQSSDPFLHATLTADVPRRHKDDPPLTFRTRTLRKTTSPKWEQEWVVANVPKTGFTLKCRLYDEDYPDHNDRLGNVTITVPHVDENWEGFGPDGKVFDVKKRSGSKRAYLIKGITSALTHNTSITPTLRVGIDVLGQSDPPYALMCTLGPTYFFKHFSPMIGRLTGTKVNRDEHNDERGPDGKEEDKGAKKYDFQANEIQLAGPVPPKLYHRYVEFRPVIGKMFSSTGLRGKVLNYALHKQHERIYNFDSSTEYGTFKPCSKEASYQFLKMAHFDEGGRIFTYVLTLDALMRFTETGREFGIDLLSKHTMHSDVARYIACSGEFFIRRLAHPDGSSDPEPNEPTHPDKDVPGGPPHESPPTDPRHYQLIIDNDSGTYRPDKSVLPYLQTFLQKNFPGMGIVVMDCQDKKHQKMKEKQREIKKAEGKTYHLVLNRSPSSSSFSSSDESRLGDLEAGQDAELPLRSKKEQALEALEDSHRLKDILPGSGTRRAHSSNEHKQEDGDAAEHDGASGLEGSKQADGEKAG